MRTFFYFSSSPALLDRTNQTINHDFLDREAPRESCPQTTLEPKCWEDGPVGRRSFSIMRKSSGKNTPSIWAPLSNQPLWRGQLSTKLPDLGWRQASRSPSTTRRAWSSSRYSPLQPTPQSLCSLEQPPSVTPWMLGTHRNEEPSQGTDPGKPEPSKEAKARPGSRLRPAGQGISGPQSPECGPGGQARFPRSKPP